MKHHTRLFLVAATLVAASSAHAAVTLINGDFQSGFSTGDNPFGWTMTEYVN